MGDKIKKEPVRIRYEGVFDWNELYSLLTGWFQEKKYDFYEEKNVKKPGTYGYEREFEAMAEREESAYVKHVIEIKMHAYHVEDIEVIVDGQKKNMTKVGMIVIDLVPTVELDWQGKWDKKFKKKAREFVHKYIIEGYIYEQMDKLHYEMYKLHGDIKDLFKMEGKHTARR